jgi:hypothetical protein
MTPAEMSAGLRRRAFEMQPFAASAPADEPSGFVSEFLQGETVVTMTAFSTGDASVYFSTGGGIIGLIGKPEVAQLARNTVKALRPLVGKLERSDVTNPPGAGDYCFYLLTPAGRRICCLNVRDTAGRDSPEVKLIGLGGALLAKIRENAS